MIILQLLNDMFGFQKCFYSITIKLPFIMRTVLFWVITQRVVVISCRRFGKTIGPYLRMTFEGGTDRLFRNVGKKLPLLAA